MPVDAAMFERMEAELLRFYDAAERRLRAVIANASTTAFARRRAELLVQQIESIAASLEEHQRGWALKNLPRSYRAGVNLTAQAFRLPVLPSMTVMDRRSIEVAIQRVISDTSRALRSVAPFAQRVWTDTQQRLVQEEALAELIAAGRLEGLGPRELGRRVSATLRDGASERLRGVIPDQLRADLERTARGELIAITGRDGKMRHYNLRGYGELVANTATRMTATEGALNAAMGIGGDLMQISVHSGACEVCLPIQGKVFSITGQTAGFPVLSDGDKPPIHPRCLARGMRIETDRGLVPIENIRRGDRVRTHRGQWRFVTATMARPFVGRLFILNGLALTGDHPVLTDRGWITAGLLHRLQESCDKSCREARLSNANNSPTYGRENGIAFRILSWATRIHMRAAINLKNYHHSWKRKVSNVGANLLLKLKGITPCQQRSHSDGLMAAWCGSPAFGEGPGHFLPDDRNSRGIAVDHTFHIPFEGRSASLRDAPDAACITRWNTTALEQSQKRMRTGRGVTNLAGDLPDGGLVLEIAPAKVVIERFTETDAKGFLVGSSLEFFATCERAGQAPAGSSEAEGSMGKDLLADRALAYHAPMLAYAGSFGKARLGRRFYFGWVYNLSVAEDESYIAEGVVTHNCRHVLIGVDPDFLRERGVYGRVRALSSQRRPIESAQAYQSLLGRPATSLGVSP